MTKYILLPLTYLGPVQLYSRYYDSALIRVEQHDSYGKQSFRNRCDIYGANGKLSLSIPVCHEKGKRIKVKETRIDYATDWRRLHWKGIISAYNSSPYFEFYKDIFEPYYRKEFVFLLDFCWQLNNEVLAILHVSQKPGLSEKFIHAVETEKCTDLRNLIHPKKSISDDKGFRPVEYSQVFSQNHGFISNLSILDLIFNMGPESGRVLKECLVTL